MSDTTEKKSPLCIREGHFSNFLRVVEATASPKEMGVTIIGGDNEQGKTSMLEGFVSALNGKPPFKEPIHRGADKADLELKIGPIGGDPDNYFVVRRRFTEVNGVPKTGLKVQMPNGAEFPRPQEMLSELLPNLFDIGKFLGMNAKEQAVTVRKALGLDTADLDVEYKEAFEDRKLVKRDLEAIKARGTGVEVPEGTPEEEVSTADLLKQISDAQESNQATERKEQRLVAMDASINVDLETIAEIDEQVKRLEARRQTALDSLNEKKAKRKALEDAPVPEAINVAALQEQLQNAETINAAVRDRKRKDEWRAEWTALEKKRAALEVKLQTLEKAKADRLTKALGSVNIPGFDITDEGVTVNGFGFNQVNTATQLKIAFMIAVRDDARLRFFRFSDGEKLTPASIKELDAIAREFGSQVLLEFAMTSEDRKNGYRDCDYFVEDGAIVE